MEWKSTLAALALSVAIAPAAGAQTMDLDDMTVDLDDITTELESDIDKVEEPTPVGEEEEEETNFNRGRVVGQVYGQGTPVDEQEVTAETTRENVTTTPTVNRFYVVDDAALDDGVLTDDEINPDRFVDVEPGELAQGPGVSPSVVAPTGRSIIVSSQAARLINPDAATAINPDAEPAINPDAEPAIRPDTGATINPDAEAAINPDAEPFINPDVGQVVDPDALQKIDNADLQRFADERRSNLLSINQQIRRNVDAIQRGAALAFERRQPVPVAGFDGLAGDLERLQNELTNLELAYGGVGRRDAVTQIGELNQRIGVARNNLQSMRAAQTAAEFGGAASAFGTQLSAIAQGSAALPGAATAGAAR